MRINLQKVYGSFQKRSTNTRGQENGYILCILRLRLQHLMGTSWMSSRPLRLLLMLLSIQLLIAVFGVLGAFFRDEIYAEVGKVSDFYLAMRTLVSSGLVHITVRSPRPSMSILIELTALPRGYMLHFLSSSAHSSSRTIAVHEDCSRSAHSRKIWKAWILFR